MASLVPPLETERWEGGGGEKDGRPLTGAAWVAVVVGRLRWVSLLAIVLYHRYMGSGPSHA
jgi:hypothetical protein